MLVHPSIFCGKNTNPLEQKGDLKLQILN